MNTSQWKSAFNNGLVTIQGFPFDRPLTLATSPRNIFVEIQLETINPTKQDTLCALILLLKSYNDSKQSTITLTLENSKQDLIPFIINFDRLKDLKSLNSLVQEVLTDIENDHHLNHKQLKSDFSDQLDHLSLPASQCCFSQVDGNKIKNEEGYIHFYFITKNNKIYLAASYDSSLFDEVSVLRMLDNWKHISHQVNDFSGSTEIQKVSCISQKNINTLHSDWNNTYSDLGKHTTLNQTFECHTDINPDKICAADINQSYSYKELDNEANVISNTLIGSGVSQGDLIAIALPRSVQLLSSILGIFKANAAYIPLDPDFPDDRLSYMAEHSQTKILITSEACKDRFSFFSGKIITLESILNQHKPNQTRPNLVTNIETTAYIIYTSGSTGKPKGVEISQLNLLNLLHSMKKSPGMEPEDSLCAVTTLSFDMSVVELFLPIYSGASVVIANKETSLYADKLIALLDKFQTNILQATPATFRLLVSQNWQPNIKTKVLCGGEPFPIDLAKSLQDRTDEVWNVYGPTETTVFSTVHHVKEIKSSVLIGRPVDNTSIYILDEQLLPVQIGMPGNLYIGGTGLAKGYLNQEQLTNERFIMHPNNSSERIYDTGDIARYTENGDIECMGRSDGQIKIRGYRIE